MNSGVIEYERVTCNQISSALPHYPGILIHFLGSRGVEDRWSSPFRFGAMSRSLWFLTLDRKLLAYQGFGAHMELMEDESCEL